MSIKPKLVANCYQCNTIQNIKICSQYTAICQKCYDQQVEQAKYFKSMRKKDPQIDQITPEVFLGNEDAATTEQILNQRGITAICVCGTNLETPFISNSKYNYKYYQIDDFPSQSIIHHFQDHYNWMNQMMNQNRKVLIHCAAGISRSSSFTIAYLMRKNGAGFQAMLEFVKSKRKYIFPNSGFRIQLQQYEDELIEKKNHPNRMIYQNKQQNNISCAIFYL